MQLKNDKRDERDLSDDGRFLFNLATLIIQTKKNIMMSNKKKIQFSIILKKSLRKQLELQTLLKRRNEHKSFYQTYFY